MLQMQTIDNIEDFNSLYNLEVANILKILSITCPNLLSSLVYTNTLALN